ncbi:MAG TPA: universal stress protein [Ferrovibrio sp.]|jgi:nucleotide-binding universal stress UspA family protein|uniref:universal stress protein n=1 Tax=Ferrovibrio sp. TaxID=1917215 RepID=UPI002B4B7302|nr:universal stress protein [Ferrovibrio sp.]HLT76008.1 universal stress protein [Ferrovibrio sp.]
MKTFLVATDFSERADRALRRATLLARQRGATITLVHVVDDDRPASLTDPEHARAAELAARQSRSVTETDGITCTSRIFLGDPSQAIRRAADEIGADLIIVGPHRRSPVRDAFVGTTAERTIRESTRPVLVAAGTPAGPYQKALIATDLSPCSKPALAAAEAMGLRQLCPTALLYAAATPAMSQRSGAWHGRDELEAAIAKALEEARRELDGFLADSPCRPEKILVEPCADRRAAEVILATATQTGADLIVLGTQGRTGLRRVLLGSVAEEVLRRAPVDVLVVPGGATA